MGFNTIAVAVCPDYIGTRAGISQADEARVSHRVEDNVLRVQRRSYNTAAHQPVMAVLGAGAVSNPYLKH